ncbi:protein shisa-5 isoform X2 [Varanus komodoensis]|uniref:protein shisa-5 isoform X2 n=1 Tax=Varanus komodoensis TaxID=61221 RepID=UPI001CF7D9DB|nr:protein shisa-5 isoform X2 [Varanus komodoensis]
MQFPRRLQRVRLGEKCGWRTAAPRASERRKGLSKHPRGLTLEGGQRGFLAPERRKALVPASPPWTGWRQPLLFLNVLLKGMLRPGLSLPRKIFCEDCKAYKDSDGNFYMSISCPVYCCGTCNNRSCCSDYLQRFDEIKELTCSSQLFESYPSAEEQPMKFRSDMDDWYSPPPSGTIIAIGVSLFILFIVTIIVCFTCSCCCLYKACRRQPRPVVTTTTATTVVQVPYPQQPAAAYPAGVYQGYNPVPVQPQPGMPGAPYPVQYPPPYPMQPAAPPAYHETMAADAGAPVTQPPYNPAYMDPPKPSY